MIRAILYRIYDADGVLLYVGATTNPATRLQKHHSTQPWWDTASEIKLQRFNTLEELAEAEVQAIKTEKPQYNLLHSKPPTWSRGPRGPRGEGTVFQRSDGLWIGRVELPSTGGKRKYRQVSSASREEAERKLAQIKADLAES